MEVFVRWTGQRVVMEERCLGRQDQREAYLSIASGNGRAMIAMYVADTRSVRHAVEERVLCEP